MAEQDFTRIRRTPEERKAARRTYLKLYMRRYRAEHPEKMRSLRIQSARTLLEKEGFTVGKDGGHDA